MDGNATIMLFSDTRGIFEKPILDFNGRLCAIFASHIRTHAGSYVIKKANSCSDRGR
jgi:hypothetical protein